MSQEPTGDGNYQYCPRCGAVNYGRSKEHMFLRTRPCEKCTWMIQWIGPLWGEAVR